MDLQASKIELAKLILNIENPRLINKIISLLKSEQKDFWHELTPDQQKEVKAAIEQLDRGEGKSWSEVRKNLA